MRKKYDISIDSKNRSVFENFHIASILLGHIRHHYVCRRISCRTLDSVRLSIFSDTARLFYGMA